MPLNTLKATVALTWALAVCGAGLLGQATPSTWVVLIGVAVLPMPLMACTWEHPLESMSARIQKVLR
jgi:hypothetical protein